MRTKIKNIFIGLIFALSFFGLYVYSKTKTTMQKPITPHVTKLAQPNEQPPQYALNINNVEPSFEAFEKFFDVEEKKIITILEGLGISRKKIAETIQQYTTQYAQSERQFIEQCNKTHALSDEIIQLVKSIMRDHGINTDRISIIPWQGPDDTAAGALSNALCINEQVLKTLSPIAQKFVISHELIHLTKQDSLMADVIENLLQEHNINKADARNITERLTHFHEVRADVLAMVKDPSLIDGEISYIEQGIQTVGLQPQQCGYPTLSQRLEHGTYLKSTLLA